MKAYWLPGISRYRRTKAEAQAESAVSPYEEVDLPDRHQDVIDHLNGIMERHERTLNAAMGATDPGRASPEDQKSGADESLANEMGYASVTEALEALRDLRAADRPQPEKPVAPSSSEFQGDVIAAILELDQNRILDALGAALDRMSEVAGFRGWHRFASKRLSWEGGSQATDRGLGMLVMAGLASITTEGKE